jgi:hypothetical protein
LAEAIGRGLVAARNRICNLCHLNAATGRLYCDTWRWLEETGLAAIDKGVRSRLITCMDSLAAIELWRETISVDRRMELTRPSAVLHNWRRATEGEANGEPAIPTLACAQKDTEALGSLQEELDSANCKIRQLERANVGVSEGRVWT